MQEQYGLKIFGLSGFKISSSEYALGIVMKVLSFMEVVFLIGVEV